MEGAFEAMGDGTVDVNWAKQHHTLWLAGGAGHGPARTNRSASRPMPHATPAE